MIEIRIPQLGEGLQEARIVRFLKQPGESVAQDEPIYEMETDKAVMEIESPVAGVIESWDAKEDDIVSIGALIGHINPEGKPAEPPSPEPELHPVQAEVEPALDSRLRGNDGLAGHPTTQRPNDPTTLLRNAFLTPRTRSYARQRGVSEEELARLVQQSQT